MGRRLACRLSYQLNESQNIKELLHRLEATLGMTGWGISLPIMTPLMGRQLLCATLLGPTIESVACKGLGGEDCLEGMLAVSAPTIAVLDADLQHDVIYTWGKSK